MLQQPALESWNHEDAETTRKNIGFTGVFVPTDVTLTSQLESAVQGLAEGPSIIRAAYSIHVLRAVMSAIEYRCGRFNTEIIQPFNRIEMTQKMEHELIEEVSYGLKRKPRTPSFASLKTDLTAWLSEVFEFAGQQRLLGLEKQRESLANSGLLRLDFTRSACIAIDAFESVTGIQGERWALLCDELELAPSIIVNDLLRLVRSTDQRLLFKLSLSPYVAGESELSNVFGSVKNTNQLHTNKVTIEKSAPPQEHEDYDTIRLWYPNKQDGSRFARRLAESVIANNGIQDQSVDDILGRSVFDPPETSHRRSASAYAPGSPRNKRMKRLAEIDESFREYLLRKSINLDSPIIDDDMRAKTLRKINAIVIVREAFRKQDSARSRKNPTVYAGASAFFAICESNPRFLIGMLNQLLGSKVKTGSLVRVEASEQAAVYSSATARFRAYLRTIPSPSIGTRPSRGLLSLIEQIGKYFHQEIVVGEFDDDADGSFKVDSNADAELCNALQRAINTGAIIWVPEKSDETLLTTVRGKRFRMSYLLAPYFQLPLHLGRSVSLGRILGLTKLNETQSEPTLFDSLDEESI
nr:hypothetical protein [Gimesia aquarii]